MGEHHLGDVGDAAVTEDPKLAIPGRAIPGRAIPGRAIPELATERLLLRPRSLADMPAMLAMSGDPEVMRFFGTRPGDDPDGFARMLEGRVLQDYGPGLGYWSLFPRVDPQNYLGWVSLDPLVETGEVQLGYRLVRSAWGHGFVSEASRAVLAYGFGELGLGEIVAQVHPDNHNSQAVMRRLGFVGEGLLQMGERARLHYRMRRPDA